MLGAFATTAGAQFNLNLNRLFDTVKSAGTAATEINEQQEAEIGKEYASLLVGAAPLVDNADVQRYVNQVGRWLSLNAERPDLNWRFGVLDSDNINAFATPGGYVFITKGLLVRLKSEAELAGVLGHEIAHVVKKHHLNAIRKTAGMQAGANIIAELAAQRGQMMFPDHVRNLVGEHAGEFRLAFQARKQSLGEKYVAARRRKGVDVFAVKHAEMPVEIRPFRV